MNQAGAITALVAGKRAAGCEYDAEERVLARFEAFCPRVNYVALGLASAVVHDTEHGGPSPAWLQPVRLGAIMANGAE
jgi:hypothetical protein